MKILIEIPDEEYKKLTNPYQYNEYLCGRLKEIVRKGTQLPGCHGRLIDASDIGLNFELSTYTRLTGIDEMPYEMATKALDEAQTIIPAYGGGK